MEVPALAPALILLSAALGAPLAAQDPAVRRDTAIVLPPIEVITSIIPAPGPDPGSGIPARTSTVYATEFDGWEHRTGADLFSGLPGISLYDDLGSPFKTTLSSRGFFASPVVGLPQGISVFLDGISVNEPDAAQVNFDLLPLAHVRRVEFLGGTASLLGPNSLGGAINLVTHRGGAPLGGELEISGGSYGSAAVAGSASGTTAGWNFYGGGGYAREDGWRQLTGAEAYNGLLNLGRAGARSGFNLQLLRAASRAETAGSLPLSIFRVQPDSNLSAGDFEDLEQWHAALSAYTMLGAGRGSATLYFRQNDAERFNVNQINDPDVRSFSENRTLGASVSWLTSLRAGQGVLSLRAGGGGSVNDVRIRLLAERLDPGLTTDVASDIADLNAYVTGDYTVGRVTSSIAVRGDYVRIPFHNLLDPAKDTISTYARFSPKGGLSAELGRGVSAYASFGQSFRAPAVIELACADPEEPCPLPFALGDDPPLNPVVATTFEVGTRYAVRGLSLDASVYRTGVRDDIFLFPYEEEGEPSGSTIDGYFANLGDTRREGLELAAGYVSPAGHSVHASYAYARATFQVDGAEIFSIREAAGAENAVARGDRFPLVPAHRVSVAAALALPAGFSTGVAGRYVGSQYLRGDEANEEAPLDPYFIADVRAGWDSGSWGVSAVVTNLFGSDNATFGTFNINQSDGAVERFLTPAQPRQVKLAVTRRFGG